MFGPTKRKNKKKTEKNNNENLRAISIISNFGYYYVFVCVCLNFLHFHHQRSMQVLWSSHILWNRFLFAFIETPSGFHLMRFPNKRSVEFESTFFFLFSINWYVSCFLCAFVYFGGSSEFQWINHFMSVIS